ncbi:hypothetical protein JHL17_23060 [Azospirillum sp. YIM B02556]|uniref:Uncharacterized protein n=1 Tax=Azospirillum endophyticum TaxID=2800326 RepID=A0ABS1FAA3_9PROT|nr:hypothetical protein [Azospirillum endophyticum]MBK1840288.1 hypothetical protein [Azospirillum endophyticum]
MKHERLNCWPDKSSRRDLYIHDLNGLLKKAGLDAEILREISNAAPLGVAWMIVKDWTIDVRYAKNVRLRDARDIVEAVSSRESGLVKWIIGP